MAVERQSTGNQVARKTQSCGNLILVVGHQEANQEAGCITWSEHRSVCSHPESESPPTLPRTMPSGTCDMRAFAGPGSTVSLNGEPGIVSAWCRSRTCRKYVPASEIEYETL